MTKSIGKRVAEDSATLYRENIIAAFDAATRADREQGSRWYADALTFCEGLAERSGHNVETIAGVVAAVSPRNPWGRNKDIAVELVRRFGTGREYHGLTLNTNAMIAFMILAGDSPLDYFTNKRLAFWHNILGDYDRVTLDGHMLRILSGSETVDSIAPSAYQIVEDIVRDAAKDCAIPPAIFQAIVWVARRRGKYTHKHLTYLDRTRALVEVT